MGAELGRDTTGLEDTAAHVPFGDLLPQGLSEPGHAELGHLVDAVAVPRDPTGDGADVDDVGDQTGVVLGGLEQVRERGVGGVEQPLGVDGSRR